MLLFSWNNALRPNPIDFLLKQQLSRCCSNILPPGAFQVFLEPLPEHKPPVTPLRLMVAARMDSTRPPSYQEVTNTPDTGQLPNTVETQDQSCKHCGASVSGGNYCARCGGLLVHTDQPCKLPPLSTLHPLPAILPKSPDKKHKYDMAFKDGNRLIYDFEKVACCPGQIVGLDPRVADALPWELEQKGITRTQWNDWMITLMDNQKRAPSISGCLCMFCFPGFLAQSILCAMFCPISMEHIFTCLPCCYGDWYAGMRQWQADVNSVLNRHDMHVKLMTYKPWQKAPKSMLHGNRVAGKDDKYEMSMMVISLTEAETKKLKMESWDQGVRDVCTSGIGRIL